MSDEKRIFCKDCGKTITGKSLACKRCGSNRRIIDLKISDTIALHDSGRMKQKRPGFKGFMIYSKFGSSLFRKTNTWMNLTRIVDRLKNSYEELITDIKTGKVIKHVKEKLTDHIGHGSAKKK